jgi:hypothetical protein
VKEVKLICWVKTPSDRRDEASSTALGVYKPTRLNSAIKVARDIDMLGEGSDFSSIFGEMKDGCKIAVGHGVCVVYPNHNRLVRAKEFS